MTLNEMKDICDILLMHDDCMDKLKELGEKIAFQEAKDQNRIQEAILIMNPKHMKVIANSGLKIQVLWSECCEEDKAYMITDKDICDNMRIVNNKARRYFEEWQK